MLRNGDTRVVWKRDRLGRSVKNLVDLAGELHKQGVQFKSLTDASVSVAIISACFPLTPLGPPLGTLAAPTYPACYRCNGND